MGNVPTIRTKLTTSAAVVSAYVAGTALEDFYVDELEFLWVYYRDTAPNATLQAEVGTVALAKGYDTIWDET